MYFNENFMFSFISQKIYKKYIKYYKFILKLKQTPQSSSKAPSIVPIKKYVNISELIQCGLSPFLNFHVQCDLISNTMLFVFIILLLILAIYSILFFFNSLCYILQ